MNYFNMLDGNARRILNDQRNSQIDEQARLLFQHQQREQELDMANSSLLQNVMGNSLHPLDVHAANQGPALGVAGLIGPSQAELEQRENLAILQRELKLQEEMQAEAILLNKIQEERHRIELEREREQEIRQMTTERLLAQFQDLDNLVARQEILLQQQQQQNPNINAILGNIANAPLDSLGPLEFDRTGYNSRRGNGNFPPPGLNSRGGLQRFSSFDPADTLNEFGLPVGVQPRSGNIQHPILDNIKNSNLMSNRYHNEKQEFNHGAIPLIPKHNPQSNKLNHEQKQSNARSQDLKLANDHQNKVTNEMGDNEKREKEFVRNDIRFFNNGVEVNRDGKVKKRDSRPLKKRGNSIIESLNSKRCIDNVITLDISNAADEGEENEKVEKKLTPLNKKFKTDGNSITSSDQGGQKLCQISEAISASTPTSPHAELLAKMADQSSKEGETSPDEKTQKEMEKKSNSDSDEDIEKKMNAADALLAIMKPV